VLFLPVVHRGVIGGDARSDVTGSVSRHPRSTNAIVPLMAQFGFVRVLPVNVASGAEDGGLAAGDGVVDVR
jgi:hypothetical protein